jgi:hypothetical protein
VELISVTSGPKGKDLTIALTSRRILMPPVTWRRPPEPGGGAVGDAWT